MDYEKSYQLNDQETYRAIIGPLTIWLRREEDELHIATQRDLDEADWHREEPPTPAESEQPEDLKWNRYILAAASKEIALRPVVPDRSLIARPESVVELPPGRQATFYISMPVWIAVVEMTQPPVTLVELPTIVLSNTWFGSTMEGELCYSLSTRARRNVTDAERRPYRAICCLEVRSDFEDLLKIQRLRVHGPNLDMFTDGQHLWTNRVVARFKSPTQGSEVEVMRSGPRADLRRVASARVPLIGSALSRMIGLFRREESLGA